MPLGSFPPFLGLVESIKEERQQAWLLLSSAGVNHGVENGAG
jgi:transcription antitermination factor NusG